MTNREGCTSSQGEVLAWIRIVLSPAVALLLLSAITRAGLISYQVLYARHTATLDFFGSYVDTIFWVLSTEGLGLAAASAVFRHRKSTYAKYVFVALIALILAFGVTTALGFVVLGIAFGALVYLLDLFAFPVKICGWSTLAVRVLAIFVVLAFGFMLAIVGELAYPKSIQFPDSTLPWLLFKATQLAISVYHGLDPAVPVLCATLLLLAPILLLKEIPRSDHRSSCNLFSPPSELSARVAIAVAVGLCLLASVLLFIPYMAAGRPIGVDFSWYIDRLSQLHGDGVATLSLSSHPAIMLVALTLEETLHVSPELAVQLTTNVVAISAVASAGWFAYQLSESTDAAVFSALFSLFSIRTTVGYFAGLLANWLGLAVVFVALGLLHRFLQGGKRRYIVFALALNVLAFATHLQTWIMLSMLILLLGLRRRELLIGAGLVLLGLAFVATENASLLSFGLSCVPQEALDSFSLHNPVAFFSNLTILSQSFAVGLFRDPILLILSILGLLSTGLAPEKRALRTSVLAWTAFAGFFVLFFDPTWAWRALYQIPYEILAALGVLVIWRACVGPHSLLGKPNKYLATVVLLVVCLAVIFNGIRGILGIIG